MIEDIAEALANDLAETVRKLNQCQSREEENAVIEEMKTNARKAGEIFGAKYLDALVKALKKID